MLFNKIDESICIFFFCEDGAGHGLVAAALAVVDVGVILDELAAVCLAV